MVAAIGAAAERTYHILVSKHPPPSVFRLWRRLQIRQVVGQAWYLLHRLIYALASLSPSIVLPP